MQKKCILFIEIDIDEADTRVCGEKGVRHRLCYCAAEKGDVVLFGLLFGTADKCCQADKTDADKCDFFHRIRINRVQNYTKILKKARKICVYRKKAVLLQAFLLKRQINTTKLG